MTIFRATLLGTSSAQPTIQRGLSATAVSIYGDRLLVDCGEGTQRQLLRFGVGLRVDLVLFTHFHADHYLGIIGLLRTLSMTAQAGAIQIYGPAPFITDDLPRMIFTGVDDLKVKPQFHALSDGDVVQRGDYCIRAIQVVHRVPTLAYAIEENPRPGKFSVERATNLGVPAGPLFGQLQAGQTVVTPGGRRVEPSEVLGPGRSGRKLCISGDTRPCDALVRAATGADILVHEATFSRAEQARAELTQHSTAAEAGEVAERAAVKQLVLTHFSSRYDHRPAVLLREASQTYAGPIVAGYDGLQLDLPVAGA